MKKIVPHLWYDTEAREAAQLYVKAFRNSSIKHETTLRDTPSGDVDVLTIELDSHQFMLISAGPYFKFTPAVSFLVSCRTKDEVDQLWKALHESGTELMPLGEYPFSPRYVWLQDKFGLSWQIIYLEQAEEKQSITPTLMFVGDQCGKAEEAVQFYTSVFRQSAVNHLLRYGDSEGPDAPEMIKHASFMLEGQEFAAMDSAYDHGFSFNEAVSFIVYCDSQEEIDYYWNSLSAVPEAEQCGWLKDKYGVSWQIVPRIMDEIMQDKDKEKLARVTTAFLKMKKFDIAALKKAAEG
jgi:predicted 3-demethylubiquinone-9 3-methyltransferase (glyoxalase superfamily)